MEEHFYPMEYWKNFSGPFPQLIFCDNATGFFSLFVKRKTRSFYGHFCFLIAKDAIASQWFYFQRQTLDHYAGAYLTFVSDPKWTDTDRVKMLVDIHNDLSLPWHKTLYDVPGVVGELLGLNWMNLPGFDFCSERGRYLPGYDLRHPDPGELREWTKRRGFTVTGRYAPG
jgi:hypothetical protein